jgi:hypothetical protein
MLNSTSAVYFLVNVQNILQIPPLSYAQEKYKTFEKLK